MKDYEVQYVKRTFRHVHRVHNIMLYLVENHPEVFNGSEELSIREVMKHDLSKWDSGMISAYSNYWTNGDKSPESKAAMDKAWIHHYNNENHHYNKGIIMSHTSIIEMVCDMEAMAIEFSEDSCKKYIETKWWPEFNEWNLKTKVYSQYNTNNLKATMDTIIDIFVKESDSVYEFVNTSI